MAGGRMQVYNGDLAAPGPECVLGQSVKSERAFRLFVAWQTRSSR